MGATGHAAGERHRLGWVEGGRGLAALAVMVSHAGTTHPVPIDGHLLGILGSWGVGFFFTLSGYIMCHVHGQDVGRPRTTPVFVWRRLIRIFPTYWIVLAVALLVNQLLQRVEARKALDVGFLLRQLLLLPGEGMFVGPAWTLRHELFFYAIFALLLVRRSLGFVALGIWGALLLWHFLFVGMWTAAVDRAPDLYLHHINLSFFIGMALGVAERRGAVRRFGGVALLAAGALAVAAPLAPAVAQPSLLQGATMLAFGAVLAGLVWLSPRAPTPRALIWLGAVSYGLYLIHLTVFIVLRGVDHLIGRPLDPVWPVRVLIQLAVALLAAGLLHHWFERPVLRRLGARRTLFGIPLTRPGTAEPLPVAARPAPVFARAPR